MLQFPLMKIFLNKLYELGTNKKIILLIAGLLIITTSATLTYFTLRPKHSAQNTPAASLTDQTALENLNPNEELKTLTILLLGYGGAGHQGGFLTDVIQLVHLDFVQAKISLISVPRDLWVSLPNGTQNKINQAFTLGDDASQPVLSGGKVAKQMAANVTGLSVNYFMAIDFVGFERLIGQELDGLTVNVPEALEDDWYPIKGEELNPCGKTAQEIADLTAQYSGFELEKQFACRYERLYFPQGEVKMEGGDALAYVRSRHGSANGDFNRSQRQHAVLKALRHKLISLAALQKAPQIFEQLNRHVTTDINLEIVEYLVPFLKLAQDFELQTVILSTDNVFSASTSAAGASILVPKNNWATVHQYFQQQFN